MTTIKLKYISCILIIIVHFWSCDQNVNLHWQNEMMTLLQKKDYFLLRNIYDSYKDQISKKEGLEIKAHILNTFNKNKASNEAIGLLLNEYITQLSDSTISELLKLKTDNYLKLFDYESAQVTNQRNISNYSSILDSSELADLNTMSNLYEPLVGVDPQQVIVDQECQIPILRDNAGLMNVEVKIKGDRHLWIFDTGAGMSVIKKSFAEELDIDILETSINVKSATDKIVKSSLAVIDKLTIGDVEVRNAVFLVMEDEMLEFPQANYYPLAIIGFPIIEELKSFSITSSDTLIVNQDAKSAGFSNMRLNGLSPNVILFNGSDSLEYSFDTGATQTHFTSDYYEKYKDEIENKFRLDTITTSSAGGTIEHITYILDVVDLFFGERTVQLTDVHVYTEPSETFKGVYGNIGQDLISQFDKMTMNFDEMFISFE